MASVAQPQPPAIVVRTLRDSIARATNDTTFAALLERLLMGPGRVLDPARQGKWLSYVLNTASVLGGDRTAAAVAAAAIACVVAAADIVDDLADDEWHDTQITPRRATNAAVALGALAHRCVGALVPLIGSARAGQIGDLLARGYLAAAAGEDADLRLEAEPDTTEEAAHEMTRRKSGTLVALACEVGATVATDDPAIYAAVGAFGTHAGMVAQILNDLAGIALGDSGRGSDIRLRKKTLPVAYALQCARDEGIAPFLAWYSGDAQALSGASPADEEVIVALIHDLGGMEYAGVVADLHRREARAALRQLLHISGQPAVGRLRRLIPAVRWQVDPVNVTC